jgi:hypothetical protein
LKTKLFLVCAAALLLPGGGARAQKRHPGYVQPRTVTLVSFSSRGDYDRSVFNFQYGFRGDKRSPMDAGVVAFKEAPDKSGRVSRHGVGEHEARDGGSLFQRSGETAPPGTADADPGPDARPRRRFDIRYGGLTLNGTGDWIEIANQRGTRSVIKDLGAMSWWEVTSVPLLRPSPAPHPAGFRLRSGRIVSPRNVFVRAVPGHMYLLRVKDAKADYQVMFRVESVKPGGECTLSWKRVPTPKS